jgi:tetratricopeptide (TPR) repeat protein
MFPQLSRFAMLLLYWLCAVAPIVHAALPAEPDSAALPPPYLDPYTPTADDEVLQQVPAASDPDVRQMKLLRDQLDRDGSNLRIAHQLARAYIEFGRQVGDAHYMGYAEAVLRPWQTQPSPPSEVMVDVATILQFRHKFTEARQELKKALTRDPNNAQGWLTLATVDMVQGEYEAAGDECSKVAVTGGLTVGLVCTGNLRSYLGQAEQSVTLLTQIEANASGQASTFVSWVEGLLAETCERLGDWKQAELHYRKALALSPRDNFLLIAYADFLLDRNRPAEVLPLLRYSVQSDTAFLRLAMAKAALRSPDLPLYTWIMEARFEALAQRGDDYFGREQVRFALYLKHDPQAALALALRNWQVQRGPWDARVFLEAALAANDPEAAAPVLTFLHQTKLQDPVIESLVRKLAGLESSKPRASS